MAGISDEFIVQLLSDPSSKLKRKGLKALQADDKAPVGSILRAILQLCDHSSESIRETAVDKLIPHTDIELRQEIFEKIQERLDAKNPDREDVEEIRLKLLNAALSWNADEIKAEETRLLCKIAANSLQDRWPEIMRKSFELIRAIKSPAEEDVANLAKQCGLRLNHNQFAIRVQSIECMRLLLDHNDLSEFPKWFMDLLPELEILLDDMNPKVRQELVHSAMKWIRFDKENNADARPSILKLIFGGLADADEILANESKEFLKSLQAESSEFGMLYGCSTDTIIRILTTEASDWKDSKRCRAVRLLKSLIGDASDLEKSQLQQIFSCIEDGIEDDVQGIRKQFEDCGRLVGVHFPFALWQEWISSRFSDQKVSSSRTFSRILGTLRAFLTGFAELPFVPEEIPNFEHLCQCIDSNRKFQEEVEILEHYLRIMAFMCGRFDSHWSVKAQQSAIECILNLDAQMQIHSCDFSISVKNILDTFTDTLKKPRQELFHLHFDALFDRLSTPQVQVNTFCSLMRNCKCLEKNMNRVLPVMTAILNDRADESRLILLDALNISISSHLGAEFCSQLISECLLPLCKWRVGRQAAEVRAIVLQIVCLLLQGDEPLQSNVLLSTLLAAQSNADDDWNPTVRQNCVLILTSILKTLKMQDYSEVDLVALTRCLVARLDDSRDEIRCLALKALEEMINLLFEKDMPRLLESVDAALIHLDDTNEKVQNHAFSFLSKSVYAAPSEILSRLEASQSLHSNSKWCNELMLMTRQACE